MSVGKNPHSLLKQLLSDSELFDDCAVTLNIDLLEVSEKVSSVTYHLEKSATAVMVLVVGLEVLCEVVDAVCEKRDLNLRRSCVTLVGLVLVDNCLLCVLKHVFSPFFFIWQRLRLRWVKNRIGGL